jgi:uroporphyrinogen-III synthase
VTVDDNRRSEIARYGVMVTRPGAAGSALVAELVARGVSAVAAPAFTIGPPPDEAATAQVLRRLADFDLVVFVSPAAARAVVERSAQPWPADTAIAAVGAATAAVVENELAGARHARRIAPVGHDEAAGSEAGSEALWVELQRAGLTGAQAPKRVLLLRAQTGREWLADRFAETGAQVESAAVYSRLPATPDTLAIAAMRTWRDGGSRAALVVTSSEAIDVIGTRWAAHVERAASGMRAWLRAGVVLAPHRRIVERARSAGHDDVRLVEATAEAVVAALAAPLESRPGSTPSGDTST